MIMLLKRWRWPLMAIVLLAALYGAYHHGVVVTNAARDAEVATMRRDAADALAEATLKAAKREREQQQTIHDLVLRYEQELTHARSETDALRDAVADGRRRLLIKAKCPGGDSAVSATAGGAVVGDGAAVELSADAQRAYFRLRDGIALDTNKLMACQQVLRELTGKH